MDKIWIAEAKDEATVEKHLEHGMRILLNFRKIRLLIVDSVAGIFRGLVEDYIQRANAMRRFKNLVAKLQDQQQFAVVCTNQVASRMDDTPGVTPCLGPIWTEFLTSRIRVEKTNHRDCESSLSIRNLEVMFSAFSPSRTASFIIETRGLESVY